MFSVVFAKTLLFFPKLLSLLVTLNFSFNLPSVAVQEKSTFPIPDVIPESLRCSILIGNSIFWA